MSKMEFHAGYTSMVMKGYSRTLPLPPTSPPEKALLGLECISLRSIGPFIQQQQTPNKPQDLISEEAGITNSRRFGNFVLLS